MLACSILNIGVWVALEATDGMKAY